MRTRSLAPKTRSGRARNVRPLNAPARAVVFRKFRRVTLLRGGTAGLWLRGELPVRVGDVRLQRSAAMDEYAITQHERTSCRNRISPVLTPVAGELFEAERIRSQQAVRARVPVRRSSFVLRMIEHRDADVFAGDATGIVDPVRALAPDGFFSAGAACVHH